MAMNTEDSLREYLRLFVRIPFVGRIGPLARTFDFVADAAPGVKEILAIGKLCYEVRERHYDLVVVDAEASGHIVGQIGAPRAISELVQVGLVRDQTGVDDRVLDDPARTGLVIVDHAGGDAGQRDRSTCSTRSRSADRASTSPRSSSTASCRRCSTSARREVFDRLARHERQGAAGRAPPGRRSATVFDAAAPGARRAPTSRAGHLDRPRRPCCRRASRCCTSPSCSPAPRAPCRAAGRRSTSATSCG